MDWRRRVLLAALFALAAAGAPAAQARAGGAVHRFAAIGHVEGDEDLLKKALGASRASALAFVVAIGIKGANENCSDKLYLSRRALFDESPRPLIVTPAASDWTECRNSAGRSNAIERLNRLRELFSGDANSLGQQHVALTRLSNTAKFRAYAENAHWQVGNVLYATVNVPANNNHYLRAAGRNSEYEDRLVANRAWLHRLFTVARREHLAAIVLFSEADLARLPDPHPAAEDGFAEIRKQLAAAAHKYGGKVLLVDAARPDGGKPAIAWRDNVGHLSLGMLAAEVEVDPDAPTIFTVTAPDTKRR